MAARARAALAAIAAAAWIAGIHLLPGVASGQQPVFRAAVAAVRLDVSVTRGASPVTGLTSANFEVHDNGVAQTIDRVSQEDIPLNLLLVLDTSGSMAGPRLAGLIEGARSLVGSLRPDDRVGLLTFSQRIALPVPPTVRHTEVLSALGGLGAAGPTALRDALFAGLQLVPPDGESRPVVVLFTDGRDTASWLAAADLEGVVRRSGVVLHAVELLGASSAQDLGADTAQEATRRARARSRGRLVGMSQSRSLQRAVQAGGGQLWSAASPGELKALFTTALDELRARYLITYTPAGVDAPGWHDVKVSLRQARGNVVARPGYFVPETR